LPEIKKGFTFAPRKSGSSLRDWVSDWEGKKEMKISKKKLQKKLAGFGKEFYFCTRFLKHGWRN